MVVTIPGDENTRTSHEIYIPKEVLDKRQENIDTSNIRKLKRQLEHARETESACIAELAELELA